MGPKMQLPDNVIVHEPKEETVPMMPPQEQEEYGGYTQEGGYCTSDWSICLWWTCPALGFYVVHRFLSVFQPSLQLAT